VLRWVLLISFSPHIQIFIFELKNRRGEPNYFFFFSVCVIFYLFSIGKTNLFHPLSLLFTHLSAVSGLDNTQKPTPTSSTCISPPFFYNEPSVGMKKGIDPLVKCRKIRNQIVERTVT
jgi:hypothetical protein